MPDAVTLRIILQSPPPGVDFALQKGSGSKYETVQKQRSSEGDLCFEFDVAVKGDRKSAGPDFAGAFVQGRAGERFVYLDIGICAGQTDTLWSRRLKVPLSGIAWDVIDSGTTLEARVPGTGKDGGPACASVKPFSGWHTARPPRS